MDEHREEKEELERLHRDLWEPDRDDHEREHMLDVFFAEYSASGLLWVRGR